MDKKLEIETVNTEKNPEEKPNERSKRTKRIRRTIDQTIFKNDPAQLVKNLILEYINPEERSNKLGQTIEQTIFKSNPTRLIGNLIQRYTQEIGVDPIKVNNELLKEYGLYSAPVVPIATAVTTTTATNTAAAITSLPTITVDVATLSPFTPPKDMNESFEFFAYAIPGLTEDFIARHLMDYFLCKRGNIQNHRVVWLYQDAGGLPCSVLATFERGTSRSLREDLGFNDRETRSEAIKNWSTDSLLKDEKLRPRFGQLFSKITIYFFGHSHQHKNMTTSFEKLAVFLPKKTEIKLNSALRFAFVDKVKLQGNASPQSGGSHKTLYTQELMERIGSFLRSGALEINKFKGEVVETFFGRLKRLASSQSLIYQPIFNKLIQVMQARVLNRVYTQNAGQFNAINDVDNLFLFQLVAEGDITLESQNPDKLLAWLDKQRKIEEDCQNTEHLLPTYVKTITHFRENSGDLSQNMQWLSLARSLRFSLSQKPLESETIYNEAQDLCRWVPWIQFYPINDTDITITVSDTVAINTAAVSNTASVDVSIGLNNTDIGLKINNSIDFKHEKNSTITAIDSKDSIQKDTKQQKDSSNSATATAVTAEPTAATTLTAKPSFAIPADIAVPILPDLQQFLRLKNTPLTLPWTQIELQQEQSRLQVYLRHWFDRLSIQPEKNQNKETQELQKKIHDKYIDLRRFNKLNNQLSRAINNLGKIGRQKHLPLSFMLQILQRQDNLEKLNTWLNDAVRAEEQQFRMHFNIILNNLEVAGKQIPETTKVTEDKLFFLNIRSILICMQKYFHLQKTQEELEKRREELNKTNEYLANDPPTLRQMFLDPDLKNAADIFQAKEDDTFQLNLAFFPIEFIHGFLLKYTENNLCQTEQQREKFRKKLLNYRFNLQLKIEDWHENLEKEIQKMEGNIVIRGLRWIYNHSLMRVGVSTASLYKRDITAIANSRPANKVKSFIRSTTKLAAWSALKVPYYIFRQNDKALNNAVETIDGFVDKAISERVAHKTLEAAGFAFGAYFTYAKSIYTELPTAIFAVGIQGYGLVKSLLASSAAHETTDYLNEIKLDYNKATVIHAPKSRYEPGLFYPIFSFTLDAAETYFTGQWQPLIAGTVAMAASFGFSELSRFLPPLRPIPGTLPTEYDTHLRYLYSVATYQITSYGCRSILQLATDKAAARRSFIYEIGQMNNDKQYRDGWMGTLSEYREYLSQEHGDCEPFLSVVTPEQTDSPLLLFSLSKENFVTVVIHDCNDMNYKVDCDVGLVTDMPATCGPIRSIYD